ncbi:putative retrotransposon hot spot protein (RHS) [Trypanosoma cruzi]|uniref:Putative retrotransposon hot spot protein (RHS) n=1 Tax=Trypanosoma cruzi TaxID=5693 RepID=A0A2V2UJ58_TRYCR|nr:putative retrotransposon hot spot protein (RHS) [Trypanosoma cruzi]
MESNPMTLVGLRMSTAGGHHTTASTVRHFTECLAAYFNGWEELSRDMSWDIIYVQHADSTPMNDWQRCDVVNTDVVSEEEDQRIAAFWKERCASTNWQYHPETLEEARLFEVRCNHRNGKSKLGRGRGGFDFWKKNIGLFVYFWILVCAYGAGCTSTRWQ